MIRSSLTTGRSNPAAVPDPEPYGWEVRSLLVTGGTDDGRGYGKQGR